ncbi:hypothetical protein FRZ03_25035 [Streptomyces misionensis]|uniref:Uncharacterized protein n=1 Tax=Streptomyces misionensis TaxID=67331 RepID=A0A5C6J6G9_9ACTN|nr:hypothetical protein [Streptomyces misionensis]TWV37148.1 hypothetical protein FRZ03_25035 [Streptomyces misionensis]
MLVGCLFGEDSPAEYIVIGVCCALFFGLPVLFVLFAMSRMRSNAHEQRAFCRLSRRVVAGERGGMRR